MGEKSLGPFKTHFRNKTQKVRENGLSFISSKTVTRELLKRTKIC